MTTDEQPLSATADASGLEALVAKYSPLGRQLRRRRSRRRAALALAVPAVVVCGFLAWQRLATLAPVGEFNRDRATVSIERMEAALTEFRQLRERLSTETGTLAAQRAELARQRQDFEQRSGLLLQQLASVNTQGSALAAQLQRFEAQGARLESTLARIDRERRELQALQARTGGATLGVDAQLAEISRQRQRLQEQQRQLREQGQLLAQEIGRINAQRLELQRQREVIEEQRAQVQSLLNEVREVSQDRERRRRDAAVARAAGETRAQPPGALASVAAVDDGKLGELRAGLNVGGDYSIAVGVTRTGTVGGVEQFSSSWHVDDLTRINAGALASTGTSVTQSGHDNSLAPEVSGNLGQSVATIIQNSLDNQALATQTVIDVSVQNVSAITQGIIAGDAVRESLSLQH